MKLLIIIPAYNESMNIERVVNHLTENYPQYDYVIVNDGSKDDTAEICRRRHYKLIDLPINLGLSGAVQAGMRYAVKNGYEVVLQMDGDGQHKPEYIEKMLHEMEESGAEIVIGSRFVQEKKPKNLRMMGSNLISGIIKLSTGKRIKDPTSGMRLFGKNVIREFAYDMNYGPEPDTISYLIKQGVEVREVQVTMDERIAGESYLNLARSVKYMVFQCFSILFIQRFRKERK